MLGRHHHGTGSLLNTDHKPIRFTRGRTTAERGAGSTRRQIGGPDRWAIARARTGALLIPHLPAGTGRATLLYGCYAMFGLSLVASIMVITMVWSRLTHYGTSGTSRVPTLWIVLGPLGQSITAAGLLGANARLAVDPQLADGMNVFAVLFGVPVWGFAVLWIALAGALTVHTARAGMPFALTWCSQRPPPPPFGAVADLCGNPVGASLVALFAGNQYTALLPLSCSHSDKRLRRRRPPR